MSNSERGFRSLVCDVQGEIQEMVSEEGLPKLNDKLDISNDLYEAALAERDATIKSLEKYLKLSKLENEQYFKKSLSYQSSLESRDKQIELLRSQAKERDKRIADLEKSLDWYGEQAEAIAKNFGVNDNALVACVTVLKLDGGNRVKQAKELANHSGWLRDSNTHVNRSRGNDCDNT